jgi:predicted RNA-binding protein with PIN domain
MSEDQPAGEAGSEPAVEGGAAASTEPGPGHRAPLPDAVRARVVAYASDTLGMLPDDEVPQSLRTFKRWAPAHRAKRAGTPLAAAVERDVTFRQRVFGRVREALPDLTASLAEGTAPPAADPVDVAAIAYLGRTPGWEGLVAGAGERLDRAAVEAETSKVAAEVDRLREQLDEVRAQAKEDVAAAQAVADAARAEAEAVSRALREEKGARRKAERVAAAAEESAAAARAEAADLVAAAEAEVSRAHHRQAEAEAALGASRKAVKEGRSLEDTRLRLLLDTVVDAAAGLRRELALPPPGEHPGDLVDAARPGDELAGAPERALLSDDPALLDQLLALPRVHLVVDGYNVTKTGYPDLPLEGQRTRLVSGLSGLAARTGAEVTCCFDGATVLGRVPAVSARGVRVLFSRPDEIADELIRRLVRAEPAGRPVVVVSSDREVADGVRRAGARPVSALALVRRLDRG